MAPNGYRWLSWQSWRAQIRLKHSQAQWRQVFFKQFWSLTQQRNELLTFYELGIENACSLAFRQDNTLSRTHKAGKLCSLSSRYLCSQLFSYSQLNCQHAAVRLNWIVGHDIMGCLPKIKITFGKISLPRFDCTLALFSVCCLSWLDWDCETNYFIFGSVRLLVFGIKLYSFSLISQVFSSLLRRHI